MGFQADRDIWSLLPRNSICKIHKSPPSTHPSTKIIHSGVWLYLDLLYSIRGFTSSTSPSEPESGQKGKKDTSQQSKRSVWAKCQIAQILSTQMICNPNFLLGFYFQMLDFNTPRPCLQNPKSWKVQWFPSCGYFSQSPHAQHLKGVNFVKSFHSRFLKGEENGKDSTIWMSVTLNVCQGSTILMLSAHNISIKVLIYRANEKQHSKVKHRVKDARNFALSKIRQGSQKFIL